MWRLEFYEMKKHLLQIVRRVRLPYFTGHGWTVILGAAFLLGLLIGAWLSVWMLVVRGIL